MNNLTLYIIDDEQLTIDLIAEYARLLKYKTRTYIHAMDFFKENEVLAGEAILILDLSMPGMDGVEVMRKMIENNIKLPIMLMSGYDSGIMHSAKQLANAHSLDIIATLAKPLKFSLFSELLHKYITSEKPEYAIQNLTIDATDLEKALFLGQLTLHFQPQVKIKDGSLIGVEALIRWNHPQHGIIYPKMFIELAEKNNLIEELTSQVIIQVIKQATNWKAQQLDIQISINISAENITSLSLPEQLSNKLNDCSLEPCKLTLEVTESALMGKLVTSLDILTRLRLKGIELSIDDFGTGYSSLSQLYRMPFTELKVDQSFVTNMTHDEEARGIVKTCITLAHELNMLVVAEGIENQETLEQLSIMGCDIAQGYYIAKPMPANEIIPWIKKRGLNLEMSDS